MSIIDLDKLIEERGNLGRTAETLCDAIDNADNASLGDLEEFSSAHHAVVDAAKALNDLLISA